MCISVSPVWSFLPPCTKCSSAQGGTTIGRPPSEGACITQPETDPQVANTDPNGELVPSLAKSGPAAEKPVTIIEVFDSAVKRHADAPALSWEEGAIPGAWKTWTWREFRQESRQAARALCHLEVPHFGSVCIVGFNSPHWLIANMAAIEVLFLSLWKKGKKMRWGKGKCPILRTSLKYRVGRGQGGGHLRNQ